MKPHLVILTFAACGAAMAQENPGSVDMVPSGLRPFSTKEPKKANEVTVVLDPPSAPGVPKPGPQLPPSPALIENAQSLPAPEAELEPAPRLIPSKKPGVTVRVEKLQTTSGPVDASEVQLLAPFPAKPLTSIPKGWKLDSSGSAPPFTREVEVTPGSKITLNIRPHVLIPDTDGTTNFTVSEPGYDASLGYHQTDTVGAILSNSVRQLEQDSKQMGDAIDRLQQLLVSLPKAPEPEPVEPPPPVAKPVRK